MSLKNHFLIPMPSQAGSYFDGTLTLLCEHNDNGAMGLIVNRRSNLSLDELLEHSGVSTSEAAFGSHPVLEGGPVGMEQGFVLHSAETAYAESLPLTRRTALSSHADILRQIARGQGPEHFIVALGYAGWGPGQLDRELESDAWIHVTAEPEFLFDTQVGDRLDYVARSAGIDLALMGGRFGYA